MLWNAVGTAVASAAETATVLFVVQQVSRICGADEVSRICGADEVSRICGADAGFQHHCVIQN